MNEDLIKSEILQGLMQVDSSLFITDFSTYYDRENRSLFVSFAAQNDNGETIEGVKNYA